MQEWGNYATLGLARNREPKFCGHRQGLLSAGCVCLFLVGGPDKEIVKLLKVTARFEW